MRERERQTDSGINVTNDNTAVKTAMDNAVAKKAASERGSILIRTLTKIYRIGRE